MTPKHQQQAKDLIMSLADRLHHHVEEVRARSGIVSETDRDVLGRARLKGWKPVTERRAAKVV